jgi:hypothetical protein
MKKKLLIFFIPILLSAQAWSQATHQREGGLIFQSFDGFGFTYKSGTKEALWRIDPVFINVSTQENDYNESKIQSFGLSLRVGREFRKSVTEQFELRYGATVSLSYSDRKDEVEGTFAYESREVSYSPGLHAILGFNYVIKNRFVIGAEILPGAVYTRGKVETKSSIDTDGETEKTSGFSVVADTRSTALITLAVRISK